MLFFGTSTHNCSMLKTYTNGQPQVLNYQAWVTVLKALKEEK